jgi:signal transduction histidine kinase
MGQLAASLAHELNQPLTAMLANAQAAKLLLARSEPDLEETRACIADIISDDQRAGEVIRRMRRLLAKSDFVSRPLELNGLVADTIGLVANEALLRSVAIEFFPTPALPVAYGDVVQIQQVILNLLTNAIAAVVNGGSPTRKVTVGTSEATEAYVEISVHDSGKGVVEADLDRIFEPFFTTKVGSLGMGLAISRTIIEAHGGRLLVENNPAGGATFRVNLRIDQPQAT